jgi:hypothetical protein
MAAPTWNVDTEILVRITYDLSSHHCVDFESLTPETRCCQAKPTLCTSNIKVIKLQAHYKKVDATNIAFTVYTILSECLSYCLHPNNPVAGYKLVAGKTFH